VERAGFPCKGKNVGEQTGDLGSNQAGNCAAEVISTGSLRLDIALGLGGIPRGLFVELRGPESSGKTTLCQHILAEAQKLEAACGFIDADHTFDPGYASRCGISLKHLVVVEPDCAEQALNALENLAGAGNIAAVALDSVASLITKAELEAALGEYPPDQVDNFVSHTLHRLSRIIQQTRTTVIFTGPSQKRASEVYHDLARHPARLSLKMQAAVRLDLQPVDPIREGGKITGQHIQVRVVKNKIKPCFQTIELDIMYNNGIRKAGEILDLGSQLRMITQNGEAYFYLDRELGEGREHAIATLIENRLVADQIEQVIRQTLIKPAPLSTAVIPLV